jgi:hypothetical protein
VLFKGSVVIKIIPNDVHVFTCMRCLTKLLARPRVSLMGLPMCLQETTVNKFPVFVDPE